MVALPDANVLIAASVVDHVHHHAATDWFSRGDMFATTPITQGSLLRFLIRLGIPSAGAFLVLESFVTLDSHVFWPDEAPFDGTMLGHVVGHRQVTDAYLLQQVRAHRSQLTTFDTGLASIDPDLVTLLT